VVAEADVLDFKAGVLVAGSPHTEGLIAGGPRAPQPMPLETLLSTGMAILPFPSLEAATYRMMCFMCSSSCCPPGGQLPPALPPATHPATYQQAVQRLGVYLQGPCRALVASSPIIRLFVGSCHTILPRSCPFGCRQLPKHSNRLLCTCKAPVLAQMPAAAAAGVPTPRAVTAASWTSAQPSA
jgi:hypothetical protein